MTIPLLMRQASEKLPCTDIPGFNREIWKRVFHDVFPRVSQETLDCAVNWFAQHPHEFVSTTANASFKMLITPSGELLRFAPSPERNDGVGASMLRLQVVENLEAIEAASAVGEEIPIEMEYVVPGWLFANSNDFKYFLYHIRFSVRDPDLAEMPTMAAVWNGYIGITGRHPMARFKEHRADAVQGKGHLLHKTWNALIRNGIKTKVIFIIGGASLTQKGIFDLEEAQVDAMTLAPLGLNVVRGGYAGIATLHELALLKNRKPSVSDRDAALVRLEGRHTPGSKCAHYRSGHIRKLNGGDRLTWVSPCWVNTDRIAA